jgi:hypothetical protein
VVEEELTLKSQRTYECVWALAFRDLTLGDWETVVVIENGSWQIEGERTLRRNMTSVRLRDAPSPRSGAVLQFLQQNRNMTFTVDDVKPGEMIVWTGPLRGQGVRIRYVSDVANL